jgi:hypothetical protein
MSSLHLHKSQVLVSNLFYANSRMELSIIKTISFMARSQTPQGTQGAARPTAPYD